MNPGDLVRVLPPFDAAFPGEYTVEAIDETGAALIDGGRGFSADYLELVQAGPGGSQAPVIARRITNFALRARFTTAEKAAIELAAVDVSTAPIEQRQMAAVLRSYLRDCDAAKFIDLTLAETVAGIQSLEAFGLLATGRAAQILDAPITDIEAA